MGLFDKLKKVTGRLPTQTILLGEYAYEREITNTYGVVDENRKRVNTSVYLEFYETNSAKILLRQNFKNTSFHVTSMPKNFKNFAITIVDVGSKIEYAFALSEKGILITSKDMSKIFAYNNDLNSQR